MKKNIVILRLLGMISFLLYILSFMFKTAKLPVYQVAQVRQVLIIISMCSFAIVMGMQVYRYYISTYLKQDEEDE